MDDIPPYTEDGIFNRIDHDNLTRCPGPLPENLDPNVTVPLIIDMHGYASNSTSWVAEALLLDDIADEVGAIVVYPDGVAGYNMHGTSRRTRDGTPGGAARTPPAKIDDVGFIERVGNLAGDVQRRRGQGLRLRGRTGADVAEAGHGVQPHLHAVGVWRSTSSPSRWTATPRSR